MRPETEGLALRPDSWGHGDHHPSTAVARRIRMRHLGVTHDWHESPSEPFAAP